MLLTKVEIRNFLTFGRRGVTFSPKPDVTTIVGPNSVGKTNLFRALEFVGRSFDTTPLEVDSYRHKGDLSSEPEISVGIKLSRVEAEAIANWMVHHGWSEQLNPGATGGLSEGFDYGEAVRLTDALVGELKPAFVDLFSRELTLRARGTRNPSHPLESWAEISVGKDTIYINSLSGLTLSPGLRSAWTPIGLRLATLDAAKEAHPDALSRGTPKGHLGDSQVAELGKLFTVDWLIKKLKVPNVTPGMVDVNPIDLRAREYQRGNEPSEARDLFFFLAGRGWYRQTVGLRDMLRLILQTSVVQLSNMRSPPERESITEFHLIPTHYGLVTGSELPSALWRLKDSPNLVERELFDKLKRSFAEYTHVDLDVVLETRQIATVEGASPVRGSGGQIAGPQIPEPTRYRQVPSLRFVTNSVEIRVEHLSASDYETLGIIYATIGNAGSVVLLDEPATNLHPSRQTELLRVLIDLARKEGIQLVIVTHSPRFVSLEDLRGLVRFDLPAGETTIRPFSNRGGAAFDKLAVDVTRLPRLVTMLFAKKVVLFEGEQEYAALPVWFEKIAPGFDFTQLGIEVADLQGEGNFRRYAPVLKKLGIPFCLIGDSKKSPKLLKGYAAPAILFPYNDLGDLIRHECGPELAAVLGHKPDPKMKLKPETCRAVARSAAPPPSVLEMWANLQGFLG